MRYAKFQTFNNWLNNLKQIWESNQPEQIIDLCADQFKWYENPFLKPYTTQQELLEDWRGISRQEQVSFNYDIIDASSNQAVVNWRASFIRSELDKKVELDGIFLIILDQHGKCTLLRQWYQVGE